jgi:hypothetical protein
MTLKVPASREAGWALLFWTTLQSPLAGQDFTRPGLNDTQVGKGAADLTRFLFDLHD